MGAKRESICSPGTDRTMRTCLKKDKQKNNARSSVQRYDFLNAHLVYGVPAPCSKRKLYSPGFSMYINTIEAPVNLLLKGPHNREARN